MIRRLALVVFVLAATPVGSHAQTPASPPPTGKELEALTAQVASELRCPVCRSLSVRDSQAELAREVEGVIRDRLAAGESPEEIKAYFVTKYGEWILLAPPKRGFNLVVWALPFVVLLGGAVLLVFVFRRWLAEEEGSSVAPEITAPTSREV
jgi:cytochrome c-type biogenesis protein CcmH